MKSYYIYRQYQHLKGTVVSTLEALMKRSYEFCVHLFERMPDPIVLGRDKAYTLYFDVPGGSAYVAYYNKPRRGMPDFEVGVPLANSDGWRTAPVVPQLADLRGLNDYSEKFVANHLETNLTQALQLLKNALPWPNTGEGYVYMRRGKPIALLSYIGDAHNGSGYRLNLQITVALGEQLPAGRSLTLQDFWRLHKQGDLQLVRDGDVVNFTDKTNSNLVLQRVLVNGPPGQTNLIFANPQVQSASSLTTAQQQTMIAQATNWAAQNPPKKVRYGRPDLKH